MKIITKCMAQKAVDYLDGLQVQELEAIAA